MPPGAVPGQQLIVNVPAMAPPPPAPVMAMPPLPTPPATHAQLVLPPPPPPAPPKAATASAAVHKLTLPDGGTLVDLVVPPSELPAKLVEAASLPTLR
eukprot:SAG31_NODE_103_length_25164_cov_12.124317_3_plen_98_part_00